MISVLHVGPHPDDEVLGAGAALRLLGMNDHRIHNLACSLGRPADHSRRRDELLEASRRLELRTSILTPPANISSGDDLDSSAAIIADAVAEEIAATQAKVVISPQPHDGHHGHETVAAGVRRALSLMGNDAPTWWMWGLWADLPIPTIYIPFEHTIMAEVLHSISAYTGENARNQYDRLYPGRAAAYAVLGAERVFGFGSANSSAAPYADLLTEIHHIDGLWRLGHRRTLDARDPIPAAPSANLGEDVSWWVEGDSITETRRRRRASCDTVA